MRKKSVVSWVLIMALVVQSLFAGGLVNERTSLAKTTKTASKASATKKSATNPPVEADLASFDEKNQDQIVSEMGVGWNLGNQLESANAGVPAENAWNNPIIKRELIQLVKKAGFDTIRIPVSYLSKIGNAPEYTIDEAWLDRIEEIVRYAYEEGMYVIINIHGDGYRTVDGGWLLADDPNEANQTVIRAKYEACWGQIATRFKDYDEHLIFESMNEIGQTQAIPIVDMLPTINSYNQVFLDTVRQTGGNNDKRWVLIPSWNTVAYYTTASRGFVMPEEKYLSDSVPEGEKRIMLSIHHYDPWAFCGGENKSRYTWGTDAEITSMKEQMTPICEEYITQGYPVVIGEFGVIDKSMFHIENVEYRAKYVNTLCSFAKEQGMVPVYWDNGWAGEYGFALFDRENISVLWQEIINAMIEVYKPVETPITSLSIEEKSLDMQIGEEKSLNLTVAPAENNDRIVWNTSDKTVATVSQDGIVTAVNGGSCIITAESTNGVRAYTVVHVDSKKTLDLKLYWLSTANWTSYESDATAEVTTDGGTYTLSVTATREQLANMGSVYIKDALVVGGLAGKSNVESLNITINNLEFNNVPCNLTKTGYAFTASEEQSVVDISLVTGWMEGEPVFYTDDYTVAEGTNNCTFTNAEYQDTNTISVSFTVSDTVFPIVSGERIPAETITLSETELVMEQDDVKKVTATLAPADTTDEVVWYSEDSKIASITSTGEITAVRIGETKIHAISSSGTEAVLQVTVCAKGSLKKDDTTKPDTQTGTKQPTVTGGQNNNTTPQQTVKKPAKVKKVSIKTRKAKTVKVSWKKVSGAKGYQISYSTNKKFKKGVKTVYTKKKTITLKKLKKNKKYYVRVCAYVTDANGKRVFGKYSAVKTVKKYTKKK